MSNSPLPADQLFAEPVPCQCFGPGDGCICGEQERALRAISHGKYPRPMTQAERDWCRSEIVAIEGYNEKDAEGEDRDVANTVLSAWLDYCRDKGLL